jgi:CheY-like chemotaxis protein
MHARRSVRRSATQIISDLPHSNPSRRPIGPAGDAVPSITLPKVCFQPGTCVVVAEDDRVSQAVLTMILQKLGLTVHVASDGVEALALIRAVAPVLVMMDMQMPRMDGTEVVRSLREDAGGPQPQVVVLSANRLTRAQEEELQRLRVADFLLKPVNRSRLQGVLVELLPKA